MFIAQQGRWQGDQGMFLVDERCFVGDRMAGRRPPQGDDDPTRVASRLVPNRRPLAQGEVLSEGPHVRSCLQTIPSWQGGLHSALQAPDSHA